MPTPPVMDELTEVLRSLLAEVSLRLFSSVFLSVVEEMTVEDCSFSRLLEFHY
jgi:hypothetical protein